MRPRQSQPVIIFLPASILLAGLGWTGAIWLWIYTVPTVGPRWLFFLCWFIALTGSALPFVAYLNKRFPGSLPATQSVIIRQSMWVGFFGALLAWFQIGRVVTPVLAFLLAAGMGILEWLLRLRERSRWQS